ncbi:sulfate ABC transporter substrate-binding protein [Cohnella endophytica]|uniref:Sulfate ABC transporter substrate-binding protein n=1 Tax=Cohnella endophytica TaxID=2419778 RepID=A0A494XDD9_9BACL|nr:sulfate ABC transporter substrate-binding protein [Cohnella endophytica]RKP48775.1 sulfate ABC transporter substrate-binding protein [Cohnella endophytica]
MLRRNGTRNGAILILMLTLFSATLSACSGGNKNTGTESESPASDYTKSLSLLNAVSDGTAELFKDIDAGFIKNWKDRTGQTIAIQQAAGGSSAQEAAIIGGQLKADVTTLGVGTDIDAIQAKGLVSEGWQQRYDYNSSPFSTAVAFVVRSGNPKSIAEWEDVVKPEVAIVTSDPRSYSDARWYYAAPWAYSLDKQPDDTEAAKAFVTSFHRQVTVLAKDDADAEKAFVELGKGDVWVTTESNALRLANGAGKGKIDVVVPSVSLTVEPVVSVVDANADTNGTREVANAYADYLFTEEAQTFAAKHFFRPRFASVTEQFAGTFADVSLLTVDDNLSGWEDLQKALFADGGLFGQLPEKS